LIFHYIFYSKTTATVFDIPRTAVVMISTKPATPGKAKI
jgi:hypothetical protein